MILMPSKFLFVFIGLILGLQTILQAQSMPTIEVSLNSRFTVVGEQTLLTVEVKNAPVIDWPETPRMEAPVSITRQQKTHVTRNGRIQEVFEYLVSGLKPGLHTIPAFQLRTRNGTARSGPVVLRVFPVSELETKGITIGNSVVPYLSGVFLEKERPYLGETQVAEAKLYISQAAPHILRLSDGQVINIEKDGIAAWRFTTTPQHTGVLKYDGHTFAVYTYRSSINALREGKLTLGPGQAEPIFQRRAAVRGGFASTRFKARVEFPTRKIEVRPLPSGAPEEFQGAVGNFTLEVSPVERELKFGDTVTVEAKITGTGNIDQFPGPFLVDPEEDWKQFDMIAKPPGSERRTSSGTVEFSQVIRPIKKVPILPPYRFVFFDPILEKFQTLGTPSQPITITGEAPALSGSGSDELNFLTPSGALPQTFSSGRKFPNWIWQIVPAALLFGILGLIFKNRASGRHSESAPRREFVIELEKIRLNSGDRVLFFREAARFATEWNGREGFDDIYETRDEICFLPDKVPKVVEPAERNQILNLLKTLSPIFLIGFFLTLQVSHANALDQDPSKAKVEILSLMATAPSPEHFYNLGLCEKALNNPGQAALWAYRFEAQGGNAGEIFKGLAGIRVREPEGTEWVSVFPKSLYFQVGFAGCWALLILLISLKLSPGKLKNRLLSVCGIVAGLGISLGFTASYLYPNEISFDPIYALSVVNEPSPLRGQAFEGGSVMREDLAGSLCKVTAERAGWSHVILPGGLSGWISSEAVTAITE